ncbi:hypothetical protein B0T24DRAFT_569140 [Lasiosphaeria ovina]|uniref:SnoaL-like domain-containing protein n=1 Tax=Lasiosphaeria ovina TaxID=92902 RepID=A0AAE0KN48_9PEZI|nr:hypothetical protein B0T24DRAFT_569140 [Lasiosphaeria ovina]
MRGPSLWAIGLTLAQAPFTALALPTDTNAFPPSRVVEGGAVATPAPCQPLSPPPTEQETAARFEKFAQAFIDVKNLTEAFTYISSVYRDGPDAALDVLGPLWDTVTITPLRRTFKGDTGWLNYQTDLFGEVVDRFRLQDGCIVEHVSFRLAAFPRYCSFHVKWYIWWRTD